IDVSHSALDEAVTRIGEELPGIEVRPEVLDYTESLAGIEKVEGRKLVLYIGSSIGNFEPFHAGALLRKVRSALNPGDALLLAPTCVSPKTFCSPLTTTSRVSPPGSTRTSSCTSIA